MSLDDILSLAVNELEKMFGARNHSRNILPVEVHSNVPQVFYPNKKNIRVKIGNSCLNENHRAYYQLGHEAVHLLSPVDFEVTTVLEEGVAVWFSHDFMKRHSGVTWDSSGDDRYDRAWHLVELVLDESEAALKDIRDKFGCFSPLTADNILEIVPKLDRQVAINLAERFHN
ncbi:hypothetical protein [Agarivorans albus]|uniref:hypothetical protein n=1 Tax=Agarivorans albus TaxID=182262 RepID=UPI000684FE7A|nr:hypothetical protein [Agarivorans albus]